MGRWVRAFIILCALALGGTALRYAYVQHSIRNQPLEITEYSNSGYTPSGVYGHGNLESQTGEFGWYIYDISDPQYNVKKVCAFDVKPENDWDIDFIYHKGQWHKLRSGKAVFTEQELRITPKTEKWKNLITTQLSFPVRHPGFFYSLKVFIDKITKASLSPREYVQALKASNPSCKNIPAP